jgi:hypothetical protein
MIFGEKVLVLLPAPVPQQILERLAQNGFALAAADLLDDVKLLEVVVDEDLTHAAD